LLDVDFVITIHDEILKELGGLPGLAYGGRGGVEAALLRVEHHAIYNGLNDVFGIAAMYGVAIASGHVFNDANKRTALACTLTYLAREGYQIPQTPELEDIIVEVAQGHLGGEQFADYLYSIFQGENS